MEMDPRDRPAFLGADAVVPVDRPFTVAQARAEGVGRQLLSRWVRAGLLVQPLHGVYHAAQLDQGIELRAACLKLVAPEDAVVTDHTAAWLHGAPMVLPPNAHLEVPRVSMFLTPGNRLRNDLADSGERTFVAGEVVDLGGVRVTSPIRTMCDLGRQRNATQAFSAMCAMANLSVVDLGRFRAAADSRRFRGYRYVRTLRGWAPHVVAGTESPGECAILREWVDCSDLPYPRIQIPVEGPGRTYFLDVGNELLRVAAEYDGPRWHGEQRREDDEDRRAWLEEADGWEIEVFVSDTTYGQRPTVARRLREAAARARRHHGHRAWRGQDRAQPTSVRRLRPWSEDEPLHRPSA